MNHSNRHRLIIVFLLLIAFAGCKKDTIKKPDPITGNNSGTVYFSFASLPGSDAPRQDIYALVSLVNKENQTVLVNRKLPVSYNQNYKTASMTLPADEYQISRLLLFDNNNIIEYAIPVAGSDKAAEVNKPLFISFSIKKNESAGIDLAVARVQFGDTPHMFGYPDGSFIPKSDDPENKKIKIRASITIGDIVYDSIPSTLTITSWNRQNDQTMQVVSLQPGENEIYLSKEMLRYRLKISRWNMTEEIMLTTAEVEDGTLYTLGGSRAARKLEAVNTGKMISGGYRGDTRETYHYKPDGRLEKIEHYIKNVNYETELSFTEDIQYNNLNKVSNIIRKDADGGFRSDDAFEYQTNGLLKKLIRTEPQSVTRADIGFQPAEGSTELNNNYSVGITYNSTQNYFTQYYNAQFYGGNILTDIWNTSHGNMISGWYEYDFNINPYVHLNIPDLHFINSWKHNKVSSTVQYTNVFPERVAYDIRYTYDAEGYPVDLVVKYKSYLTGEFLYQTKSVFYYK